MNRAYLPRSAIHPRLVTGPSRIAGTGVFAREAIRKGEQVMEFGGQLISREEMLSGNYRYRSIWPVAKDRFLALPLTDEELSLDEYLNHSCDANCWLEDEVTLSARRDIAAGEEITLDQGTWNIEDAYVEDRTACTCGAADCRVVLTEEDWQLPAVQRRYAGHFHPMIRFAGARWS
jgi:SET domain-containing protein